MSPSAVIALPESLTFYRGRGVVDFDRVIQALPVLTPDPHSVVIDVSRCISANFQALAFLVQYAWFLSMNERL